MFYTLYVRGTCTAVKADFRVDSQLLSREDSRFRSGGTSYYNLHIALLRFTISYLTILITKYYKGKVLVQLSGDRSTKPTSPFTLYLHMRPASVLARAAAPLTVHRALSLSTPTYSQLTPTMASYNSSLDPTLLFTRAG